MKMSGSRMIASDIGYTSGVTVTEPRMRKNVKYTDT